MEAGGRGRPPPRAQGAPGLEPEKGKGDAGYGVENPEEVAVVVVDHHVAADLLEWQVIPPYLQQADGFEGEDVEDEDVERVVADEYQQTLQRGFPAGDQGRQIVDGDEACDAGQREREEILVFGTVVHPREAHVAGKKEKKKTQAREPSAFRYTIIVYSENHAGAEEEYSPRLTPASVGDYAYLEIERYPECGQRDHRKAYQEDNDICARANMVVHVSEYQKEHQGGDEQTAEEPERTGHELVVARHAGHHHQKARHGLTKSVRMRYASREIAELLVEYSEMMPDIVQEQKQDAPFQEREIETLDAPGDESPGLVDIIPVEAVTGRHEEEGHMESIYEVCDIPGCLGMSGHHKDYGNAFRD